MIRQIHVCASSDQALALVASWGGGRQAADGRLAIAADSLALWHVGRKQPESLWNLAEGGKRQNTAWPTEHARIASEVRSTLCRLWPELPAEIIDAAFFELSYVLAPITLVGRALAAVATPRETEVWLDPKWQGSRLLGERLAAEGWLVQGGTPPAVGRIGRQSWRTWARTAYAAARHGFPRSIGQRGLLLLVTTPHYVQKLAPDFLSALAGKQIRAFAPLVGGADNRQVCRMLRLPGVNVTDLLAASVGWARGGVGCTRTAGDTLLEHLVARTARGFLHSAHIIYQAVRGALRRIQPAVVATNFQGFMEGAALFAAARELGIPTVLLQAGAFTVVSQYVQTPADYYLARNEASAGRLIAAGIPKERVCAFGSVFGLARTAGGDVPGIRRPAVVGVCSTGLYGSSDPNHWGGTARLAQALGGRGAVRLLVRPHPTESREVVQAMAGAFLDGQDWTLDSSADIGSFLASVDCVLHDQSTVGLDAQEMGVPEVSTDSPPESVWDSLRTSIAGPARTGSVSARTASFLDNLMSN